MLRKPTSPVKVLNKATRGDQVSESLVGKHEWWKWQWRAERVWFRKISHKRSFASKGKGYDVVSKAKVTVCFISAFYYMCCSS
ncbi:unnamed protein product [Linum tenue]|uniref:Uncharacterized protein n=1 Tax=Linum tenue TaxID=586396 RepID=A0AAV0HWQ1_9ROSI|nr:unnamed protein product [Linum tenue]